MILTAMTSYLRTLVGASDGDAYTDAILINFLDLANIEVVNKLDTYDVFLKYSTESLTVVANTKTYTFSANATCRKILRIRDHDNDSDLIVTDFVRGKPNDPTNSVYWNKSGGQLIFWTDPSFASTYTIYYLPFVTSLASEGAIYVPESHHLAIVYKACELIGRVEGRTAMVNNWMQKADMFTQEAIDACLSYTDLEQVKMVDE